MVKAIHHKDMDKVTHLKAILLKDILHKVTHLKDIIKDTLHRVMAKVTLLKVDIIDVV